MGTGTPLPLNPQEMRRVRGDIKNEFPQLADSFQVTSLPADQYNCIAWAAEDQWQWWWPDIDHECFWPAGIDRNETIEGFVAAFRVLGYEPCFSEALESGYEKVAIFAVSNRVKHMARQLSSGDWTSKLGDWWDIRHETVDEISAPHYGRRQQVLKRILRTGPPIVPSET